MSSRRADKKEIVNADASVSACTSRLDRVLRIGIEQANAKNGLREKKEREDDVSVVLVPPKGAYPQPDQVFIPNPVPSVPDPGKLWRDQGLPVPGIYQDRKSFAPPTYKATGIRPYKPYIDTDEYGNKMLFVIKDGKSVLKKAVISVTSNGHGALYFDGPSGQEYVTHWIPASGSDWFQSTDPAFKLGLSNMEEMTKSYNIENALMKELTRGLQTEEHVAFSNTRPGGSTIQSLKLNMAKAIQVTDEIPPPLQDEYSSSSIASTTSQIQSALLEFLQIASALDMQPKGLLTQDGGLQNDLSNYVTIEMTESSGIFLTSTDKSNGFRYYPNIHGYGYNADASQHVLEVYSELGTERTLYRRDPSSNNLILVPSSSSTSKFPSKIFLESKENLETMIEHFFSDMSDWNKMSRERERADQEKRQFYEKLYKFMKYITKVTLTTIAGTVLYAMVEEKISELLRTSAHAISLLMRSANSKIKQGMVYSNMFINQLWATFDEYGPGAEARREAEREAARELQRQREEAEREAERNARREVEREAERNARREAEREAALELQRQREEAKREEHDREMKSRVEKEKKEREKREKREAEERKKRAANAAEERRKREVKAEEEKRKAEERKKREAEERKKREERKMKEAFDFLNTASDSEKLNWLEQDPYNIKDVKPVILEAVKNLGSLLQYASDRLRDDKDIVLAAIKNNGLALEYASYRMRSDKDIVFIAMEKDVAAFKYASYELRDDKDLALAAVKKMGILLQFASDRLRDDRNIVMTAGKRDGRAIQFASDRLKNDNAILLGTIGYDRMRMRSGF